MPLGILGEAVRGYKEKRYCAACSLSLLGKGIPGYQRYYTRLLCQAPKIQAAFKSLLAARWPAMWHLARLSSCKE